NSLFPCFQGVAIESRSHAAPIVICRTDSRIDTRQQLRLQISDDQSFFVTVTGPCAINLTD
ncbi:unnamed protein product, partial [Musa acuminata subsp. burmannicoides]